MKETSSKVNIGTTKISAISLRKQADFAMHNRTKILDIAVIEKRKVVFKKFKISSNIYQPKSPAQKRQPVLFKIAAYMMLLSSLFYSGGYRIAQAKFLDTVTSTGNTFTASTLLFSLSSPNDFTPSVTPTVNATRSVNLSKSGALDFNYRVKAANFAGTLCSNLNLVASLGGNQQYSGVLTGFNMSPFASNASSTAWTFTASLNNTSTNLINNTCTFDIIYNAWQTNLTESTGGFSDSITLSSTVNAGNWAQCASTSVSFPANLALLAAGSSTSFDDVLMAASTAVTGNVQSNHDIRGTGSPKPAITGNATASNLVSTSTFSSISGTVSQHVATTSLPNVSITNWETNAQQGGTVNGSFIFPNGTTGVNLGPTEILGNLTFGSSNSTTINGPIYVHGNLTFGTSTAVTMVSTYGSNFLPIIVDGTITINPGVTFSAPSGAAFLVISNSTAQTNPSASILLNGNSSNVNLGPAVLYATNGNIHINKFWTILAAFAAHGTSATNTAIDLENNDTVSYSSLPTQIACGFQLTHLNQVVINEFVPNPSGTTTGDTSSILPNSLGNFSTWSVTGTSTAVNAVTTNDGDASFVTTGSNNAAETFSFPGLSLPASTTINSVTLHVIAKDASAQAKIMLRAEKGTGGGNQNDGISTFALTNSYADYSRVMTTNPFTSSPWTQAELSSWTTKFGVITANNSGSPRVTQVYLVVNYSARAEWVELYNGTSVPVNVNGWVLYNSSNADELVINASSTNNNLNIPAGGYLVATRTATSLFYLDDVTDTVRLFSDKISNGGTLKDSISYSYGTTIPVNKSFARVTDGTSNIIDPDATPDGPNLEFFTQYIAPDPLVGNPDLPQTDPEVVVDQSSNITSDVTPTPVPTDTPTADVVVDPTPTPTPEATTSDTSIAPDPDPTPTPDTTNSTTTPDPTPTPDAVDSTTTVADPTPTPTPVADVTAPVDPAPANDTPTDQTQVTETTVADPTNNQAIVPDSATVPQPADAPSAGGDGNE